MRSDFRNLTTSLLPTIGELEPQLMGSPVFIK